MDVSYSHLATLSPRLSSTGRQQAQEIDHSPLTSRGTSRDYQSIADQSSVAGAFSRGASREYVDSMSERPCLTAPCLEAPAILK